jgi:hypothetical protein
VIARRILGYLYIPIYTLHLQSKIFHAQAKTAYKGSWNIAPLIRKSSGQRHVMAALDPGRKHGSHWKGDWVGPRPGLDGSSLPGMQIL